MSERIYDPTQIEARWQKWWDENHTNEIDLAAAKNPFYVLMMFPYPSAEGLHVGNVYAFTGADIQGRYRRLAGYDVFEPIGFDAFGIHSENFAMKVNRHPAELVPSNVRNFTRQLKMMAFMFDWRRTVDTTLPEYYKWTQWIFLQLYKAGLAYRDTKEVNFCPQCGTVIADEQVNTDGTCERHGDTLVERRKMPCWFFRITEFSDRLLDNHQWLDWSETTKTAQVNWIGRSTGAEVDFQVAGRDEKIRVFTTRPDTLFGATFMVLSPEHPMVDGIVTGEKKSEVEAYKKRCASMTDLERSETKEKTGVFTGAFAINPVTGMRIPIWIADYVLMGYGTGAIMAVPSGDHRDIEFAKKFHLPVTCIVNPIFEGAGLEDVSGIDTTADDLKSPEGQARIRAAVSAGTAAWSGPGTIVNSSNAEVSLDGLEKPVAIARMIGWLERHKLGHHKAQYRLRDWGISRQRYWGPPIPIVYDEEGNAHPVPEDQLPVELPPINDFRPKGDGRGPLANVPEWVNVTIDGKQYRRETDVMDNFLDSAWYYLRYVSARDDKQAYDPALIEKWLPVDVYIGGNEHSVLHLLYTRFICMALEKAGALKMGVREEMRDHAEPFRKFRAHGLLIKDGSKMSKSKGNVVNPDAFVEQQGSDTLRTYLMFLGPYTYGGDFRDKDIMGVRRFFNRTYDYYMGDQVPAIVADESLPKDMRVKVHQTIKKVGGDIENLSYNTAVAALMELLNLLRATPQTSTFVRESFCVMIAPFAPHLAEEIWHEALGHKESVFDADWPKFVAALTLLDEIEIPVQINGKVKDRVLVPREADNAALEKAALACDAVQKGIADGQKVIKTIVVPGRLVNFILK